MNHLSREKSAYLRSAAHQPVNWYAWRDEAFAQARKDDKPILLDIGAVWCHWCHVMDGESYENDSTATIINENFIAIKVDRDERPDIDHRYQEAVSAISGHGGWPLTAFLTPEGEVFFGGTYFPPEQRHGRIGFPDVLLRVAAHYRDARDSVLASARQLSLALATSAQRDRAGLLSLNALDDATADIIASIDMINGGFGSAPKFPHSTALEFLINRQFFRPVDSLQAAVKLTLSKMARGGVYDHVGGGFHRYSTDERWIVPHFEKMLYDNTELLRCYATAAAAFGDSAYAATARGVAGFLMDVLSDQQNGGFYTSQDADVGLEDDGDFFTWSLTEVRKACSADEAAVLAERYHILEHGEMHHNPAKNVLFVAADTDVVAMRTYRSEPEVTRLLESGLAKLRRARAERPTPFVDTSIYASWNGMAISACLIAADYLELPAVEAFALRSLDRVLAECVGRDGRVQHAIGNDTPVGLLDDGVFVARACLDAYERTSNDTYLASARLITNDLMTRLWDRTSFGFFDVEPNPKAIGLLSHERKSIQDAPTPSGNAVAAELLLRLSEIDGSKPYASAAESTLTSFAGQAAGLGFFGGAYFLALDRQQRGTAVALVTGPVNDPVATELWDTARRSWRPYLRLHRGTNHDGNLPDALKAQVTTPEPRGYFCAGNACAFPATDAAGYAQTLQTFGK